MNFNEWNVTENLSILEISVVNKQTHTHNTYLYTRFFVDIKNHLYRLRLRNRFYLKLYLKQSQNALSGL